MAHILERYINGPYEEDPLFQSTASVTGIAHPVEIRVYIDALIILVDAATATRHPFMPGMSIEAEDKGNAFRVHLPQDEEGAFLGKSTFTVTLPAVSQAAICMRYIIRCLDSVTEDAPVLMRESPREDFPSQGARMNKQSSTSTSGPTTTSTTRLSTVKGPSSLDGSASVAAFEVDVGDMGALEMDFDKIAAASGRGGSGSLEHSSGVDSLDGLDYEQPGALRKATILNARYVGQVFIAIVTFACVYVLVCRWRAFAACLMVATWLTAQPAYHIFPWALGARRIATVAVMVPTVTILMYFIFMTRYLYDNGHQHPEPIWIIHGSIRQFLFTFVLYVLISTVFYYRAWRRGVIPERSNILGRRGRCQYDLTKLLVPLNVLTLTCMLVLEPLGPWLNSPTEYVAANVGIYGTLVVMALFIAYFSRRRLDEYSFQALVRYLPTLAFGTYTIGRVMRFIIVELLRNIPAASVDSVLPFVFVIYKLIFVALYPYFYYLSMRMGRRKDQMQYMFPVQFMDCFVLDTYAIASDNISGLFFIFVFLRVTAAVLYQAGIVRKLTNRLGFTSPAWSDVEMVGARVSASIAPTTGPALADLSSPTPISTPPDSLASTPHLSRGSSEYTSNERSTSSYPMNRASSREAMQQTVHVRADNPVEIGSRLYHVLREPCGDSPLGQWLFFVQGSMAGMISISALMSLTLVDHFLPEPCILLCGIRLGVVQTRAAISLVAWLLTIVLTFLIARRNFIKTGFSDAELVTLTARHLRASLPVLLTFALPVVTYVLDYTSLYIKGVNGIVAAQNVTPQFGV